ncbi:MAG: hypothetical protein KKB61_05425, partial [Alphaproteobacteria bacterium]|nr:hypothetical protein [Alphaproteobacteria bacterium]
AWDQPIVDMGTSNYMYAELTGPADLYKSADGYAWVDTCLNGVGVITAIEPSDNYSEDKTVYGAVDSFAYTTIYRCTNAADEDFSCCVIRPS